MRPKAICKCLPCAGGADQKIWVAGARNSEVWTDREEAVTGQFAAAASIAGVSWPRPTTYCRAESAKLFATRRAVRENWILG